MAKVLIIDDDVTLRQALTKHLEHAGHEVRQAADGNAGVRAYERRAADLVIVDIFMPGQGGLQTIGRLRREWPGVKILGADHDAARGPDHPVLLITRSSRHDGERALGARSDAGRRADPRVRAAVVHLVVPVRPTTAATWRPRSGQMCSWYGGATSAPARRE